MSRPSKRVKPLKCAHCGKTIPRSPTESPARYALRKNCSRQCAILARRACNYAKPGLFGKQPASRDPNDTPLEDVYYGILRTEGEYPY